jgi:hypothetical protein
MVLMHAQACCCLQNQPGKVAYLDIASEPLTPSGIVTGATMTQMHATYLLSVNVDKGLLIYIVL